MGDTVTYVGGPRDGDREYFKRVPSEIQAVAYGENAGQGVGYGPRMLQIDIVTYRVHQWMTQGGHRHLIAAPDGMGEHEIMDRLLDRYCSKGANDGEG